MEQQFTNDLHHALNPALQTSLEVLAMPLPQLAGWLEERIEQNPLLSLDPIPSQEEEKDPISLEELSPLQEIDGYERPIPRDSYRERVTQIPPLVEQRDLFEFLAAQARERFISSMELSSALNLISQIDEKGYLPSSIEDSKLLYILQSFDPPGIAARSVRECLLLQLKRRRKPSPLARTILEDHYEDFLHQRVSKLCRKLGCKEEEFRRIIRCELSTLSLNPAALFQRNETTPWIPDLLILEEGGIYRVEVEQSLLPRICFDPRYNDSSFAKDYVSQKRKEAFFIRNAIKKRSLTLLRLGKLLLKTQYAFLEGLENHLQPLTLEETALALKLHRSTIGRAIAGKVVSTPRGILALEDFFRRAGALSSAVEKKITQLISEENKSDPLSDDAIAKHLQTLGCGCSRRTVAKYRKSLNLQPARFRKI